LRSSGLDVDEVEGVRGVAVVITNSTWVWRPVPNQKHQALERLAPLLPALPADRLFLAHHLSKFCEQVHMLQDVLADTLRDVVPASKMSKPTRARMPNTRDDFSSASDTCTYHLTKTLWPQQTLCQVA
jgi:hypothetical protein